MRADEVFGVILMFAALAAFYYFLYRPRHRRYGAVLAVYASESALFNYCLSAMEASNVRIDGIHRDLGQILALKLSKSWFFSDKAKKSQGVDVDLNIEPTGEPGLLAVGILGESHRSWFYLWSASFDEAFHFEAKQITLEVMTVLKAILDRQGVRYEPMMEVDFKKLKEQQTTEAAAKGTK
jgi:hypothetical protein